MMKLHQRSTDPCKGVILLVKRGLFCRILLGILLTINPNPLLNCSNQGLKRHAENKSMWVGFFFCERVLHKMCVRYMIIFIVLPLYKFTFD